MVEYLAPGSTVLEHDHGLAARQLADVVVLVLLGSASRHHGPLRHLAPAPAEPVVLLHLLLLLLLAVPLGQGGQARQVEHGDGGADLHTLCIRVLVVEGGGFRTED